MLKFDCAIPPKARGGSVDELRRSRLVLAALLVSVLAITTVAGVLLSFGFEQESAFVLVSMVVVASLYGVWWGTGSSSLIAHAFLLFFFAQIAYDYGASGRFAVLGVIALPIAAASLIGPLAGAVWTVIGVFWATYLGPQVFRTADFDSELGIGAAIMTVVAGVSSTIVESMRAKSASEAAANQQLLEIHRERVRDFVESTFPGIAITRGEEVEYVSPRIQELLGYSQSEFAVSSPETFVHKEDLPVLVEQVRNPRPNGFHGEIRFRHKSKQWVWFEIYGIPQGADTGEPERWLFAGRNVQDERRRREQNLQNQRLDGIGYLAAGVAHDFNNLLTVILGHAELMPEGEDRDQILLAATRAAELTKALMTFGREAPDETETIDLVKSIKTVLPMFRSLLGSSVELLVGLPDRKCLSRIAGGKFEQVLLNLVSNAKEAIEDHGVVRIEMESVQVDDQLARTLAIGPGDYHHLQVVDSGVGMTQETLQHAFDPFYSTKPPPVGLGLGLASVYGIVRQAGGAIELESNAGEGSIAHLYLPTAV